MWRDVMGCFMKLSCNVWYMCCEVWCVVCNMAFHVWFDRMSCGVVMCNAMQCHIMPCHIICHVMSYHVISCHMMPHDVAWCHHDIMPHDVIWCDVNSCNVIWWFWCDLMCDVVFGLCGITYHVMCSMCVWCVMVCDGMSSGVVWFDPMGCHAVSYTHLTLPTKA